MTLDKHLEEIEAKRFLERNGPLGTKAPQLVDRLLKCVRVLGKALKEIKQEIHDEHCDIDWHCNWCEALMITETEAERIMGEK